MELNPRSNEAYKLLHNGTLALTRAERQGIRVDLDYVAKKRASLDELIAGKFETLQSSRFYRAWKHYRGGKAINIDSPQQLQSYLYKHLKKIPPKTTESGQGSTDDEALRDLNIPELNLILDIRKYKKIRDTYLKPFQREAVNGVIHPFFSLNRVRTYRSSSDKPNFQNIPAMQIVRRALFPRPGHQLLEVDYSALEVAIAACYHKDPTMLDYVRTDPGAMHGDMAQKIFFLNKMDKSIPELKHLRSAAKNSFVFPQFYGDYYGNNAIHLAQWVKLPTEGTWPKNRGVSLPDGTKISDHMRTHGIKSIKAFMDHMRDIEEHFWEERFPVYKRWKEEWWQLYQKYGYIDMYTGFHCQGLMGKNNVINYPVQGSAFHCLLWSFIELDRIMREEKWDTRLIGQIHDAIILDVNPRELDHVIKIIHRVTTQDLPKAWKWIIVPLEVEADLCPVDASWAQKQEYEFIS